MILLPFGCYCSQPKVHPKNWESINASTKKGWYVFYRFYDPTCKDDPRFKNGKLVILKGFNHLKDLAARQSEARSIIAIEINKLKENAYNPAHHNIMKIQPNLVCVTNLITFA
ncbi:MAG TPA: hypothetical protein VK705_08740 [Ferruginibacter sp.]|jgi:hypothetical protein|nr:hypothetical protein [Ferruginibacter sp.]